MTILTRGTIGYVDEVIYGTRVIAGTPADTVTYLPGHMITDQNIQWPVEKPVMVERESWTSYDPSEILYGAAEVPFVLRYYLSDPQVLQYIYGLCAVGGAVGGVYPHTMTCIEPADGAAIASRTFHLETIGMVADKYIDVHGALTEKLSLTGIAGSNIGVLVTEELFGQRITDEDADTNEAVTYTAAPAPITSTTKITEQQPYRLTEVGIKGVNIIADIRLWNITTTLEYLKNRSIRDTLDNYGHTINRYLSSAYIKKRTHNATLNFVPSDLTKIFFEKLQDKDRDTELTIKIERTSLTPKDHEIEWIFDATICPVTDITGKMQPELMEENTLAVNLQPRVLTSCISNDEEATYSLEP